LATVILTPIDEVGSFPFLKPCRKTHHGHIPGWQWQDSSGSNFDKWLGGSMKNHFHKWIGCVQTLNSLQVFGMCWRRLYRVLNSCIVNTRSWPKNDAPLDGNKCSDVFSIKRCIDFFFCILYWQFDSI